MAVYFFPINYALHYFTVTLSNGICFAYKSYVSPPFFFCFIGTPAQPRSTYVNVKQLTANGDYKMPELGWAVDSWSPLLEYQLQYKKQQVSGYR